MRRWSSKEVKKIEKFLIMVRANFRIKKSDLFFTGYQYFTKFKS